jgi:hypothetical protein
VFVGDTNAKIITSQHKQKNAIKIEILTLCSTVILCGAGGSVIVEEIPRL